MHAEVFVTPKPPKPRQNNSARVLRLADLAGLATAERNRRLTELVAETRRTPAASDVAIVDERIAAFEAQHGMSSSRPA